MTDLERCEMEIQSIRSDTRDHPLWLTALGDADWCVEAELIRRAEGIDRVPTEPSVTMDQYSKFLDGKRVVHPAAGFADARDVESGRKFLGCELKESYFTTVVSNLKTAHQQSYSLFDDQETEEPCEK